MVSTIRAECITLINDLKKYLFLSGGKIKRKLQAFALAPFFLVKVIIMMEKADLPTESAQEPAEEAHQPLVTLILSRKYILF